MDTNSDRSDFTGMPVLLKNASIVQMRAFQIGKVGKLERVFGKGKETFWKKIADVSFFLSLALTWLLKTVHIGNYSKDEKANRHKKKTTTLRKSRN